MFGSPRSGANAYAKVGLETGALAASPHKLISMLFEGAMIAIVNARKHMEAKEFEAKGAAISKAITIIDTGLCASLNMQEGGEVAQHMQALYLYMTQRLQMAHLKNDPNILKEVYVLLNDLRTAWDAIGPQVNNTAQASNAGTVSVGAVKA